MPIMTFFSISLGVLSVALAFTTFGLAYRAFSAPTDRFVPAITPLLETGDWQRFQKLLTAWSPNDPFSRAMLRTTAEFEGFEALLSLEATQRFFKEYEAAHARVARPLAALVASTLLFAAISAAMVLITKQEMLYLLAAANGVGFVITPARKLLVARGQREHAFKDFIATLRKARR